MCKGLPVKTSTTSYSPKILHKELTFSFICGPMGTALPGVRSRSKVIFPFSFFKAPPKMGMVGRGGMIFQENPPEWGGKDSGGISAPEVCERDLVERDVGDSLSHSGIIPESVWRTIGMPVSAHSVFWALFAFNMVSAKCHLIDNSMDLIF